MQACALLWSINNHQTTDDLKNRLPGYSIATCYRPQYIAAYMTWPIPISHPHPEWPRLLLCMHHLSQSENTAKKTRSNHLKTLIIIWQITEVAKLLILIGPERDKFAREAVWWKNDFSLKIQGQFLAILADTVADQMSAGSNHPYCPRLLANRWPVVHTAALPLVDC